MSKSTSKFPTPYVNSVSENDPYVVRVDQDHGQIGSRPSATPGYDVTGKMGIEHVGMNATGRK